jgi:hypothetical protein
MNGEKQVLSSSLEGDIIVHDVATGKNLIEKRILGEKKPIEGNTCYSLKTLSDGLSFVSTHEDCVT